MNNISFDQTKPIVERALGDSYSAEVFFEVHQAFTYLLNAEPTIPANTYDNIVRSLANVYRYATMETCRRIADSVNDVKRELSRR